MVLTRSFRNTVIDRARRDLEFRSSLLVECMQCCIIGDVEIGKVILRNYIHASMGFDKLSRLTGKDLKYLVQMFEPDSNPQVSDFFDIIWHIQRHDGIHIKVAVEPIE